MIGGLLAVVVCAILAAIAFGSSGGIAADAASAVRDSAAGSTNENGPIVDGRDAPTLDAQALDAQALDAQALDAASPEAGPDATGPPATDQAAPPASAAPPSPSASASAQLYLGGVEVFEVEAEVAGEPSEANVILRADQSGAVTEVISFADAGVAADALVARGVVETPLDALDGALGSQAYVRIGRFVLIAPGTPASLDLLAAQAHHLLGVPSG